MLFNKHKAYLSTSVFLAIATSALSYADSDNKRRRPHTPPPEAIEACTNFPEGAVCSFTGRKNKVIEGSCIIMREDETTAVCAPENHKHSKKNHSE